MTETVEEEEQPSTYSIRPSAESKFNREIVRECIKVLLHEELSDKTYDASEAEGWTKSLAESLQNRIKELSSERYKFVVHIALSEQKGQGIKICSRCLWDADTDNFVTEVLSTESFICVVAVFASYYY